jgi:hypothetical protein
MTARSLSLLFLIAALALVPLMPSGDSIWVDEAQTWRYARHTSISGAWEEFRNDRFSEAQMPLGMAAAWGWAQLLGTSEWALRAPNMVYAVGAILCFYLIGRRERIPLMPLFLAVQPFLWFYVNEARPYALQIFGGSLLLLSLYDTYRGNLSSPRWAMLWALGALISSASSMLGAIPTLAVSIAMASELLRRRIWPSKIQFAAICTGAVLLLALGAYYIKTLLQGAGGAKIWNVGLQNAFISAIEFLGFAGLLPARHELRSIARAGLTRPDELLSLWPFAIATSVLFVVLLAIGLHWILNFKLTPRWVFACLFAAVASASLLLAASLVIGFPFWGRHLAAAFPAFVAATCWAVSHAWRGASSVFQLSSAALVIVLLGSSLALRFSDLHARDDYRSAAAAAQETLNAGGSVFWAANRDAAKFYGLAFSDELNATKGFAMGSAVYLLLNIEPEQADRFNKADTIILSKPDIYDAAGGLRNFIKREDYDIVKQLPSFWIFSSGKSLRSDEED